MQRDLVMWTFTATEIYVKMQFAQILHKLKHECSYDSELYRGLYSADFHDKQVMRYKQLIDYSKHTLLA